MAVAVIAAALVVLPSSASGAAFTVTEFDDPAPGGCDPGDCSLREAIIAANGAAGADTISLAAGTYTLSIAPGAEGVLDVDATVGDLDITDDLTIQGAGAVTITGGATFTMEPDLSDVIPGVAGFGDRVLHVDSSTVELTDLTITGGDTTSFGGGVLAVDADLTLNDVTVEANLLSGDGLGCCGGGMAVIGGTAMVASSLFTGNALGEGDGGGALFVGGEGHIDITDTDFVSNHAPGCCGGALLVGHYGGHPAIPSVEELPGSATIDGATFSDNSAFLCCGSAIYVTDVGDPSVLEISDSSLTGNLAHDCCAALFTDGEAYLESVSFIDNHSPGDCCAGAIFNNPSGHVEFVDGIVSENSAVDTFFQVPPDPLLIFGGGGIYNAGEMLLSGVDVTDNAVTGGDDCCAGAGIFNKGDLYMEDGVISGNAGAVCCGAGLFNDDGGAVQLVDVFVTDNFLAGGDTVGEGCCGGGIYNFLGALLMEDAEIAGNSALVWGGGGLMNEGGDVVLIGVDVVDNEVDLGSADDSCCGGGIYNGTNSTLLFVDGAIANNTVRDIEGGGLYLSGDSAFVNTTISGNSVGSLGGGVFVQACCTGAEFVNVTVANNESLDGSAAGIHSDAVDALALLNTIVGDNIGGPQCDGDLLSLGGNLSSDATCSLDDPTDLLPMDPRLEVLGDNGGDTLTHGLRSDSPAIDAGIDPCPGADQRGVPRPQGGACDIGALEFLFPPVVPVNRLACPSPVPGETGTDLEIECTVVRIADGAPVPGQSVSAVLTGVGELLTPSPQTSGPDGKVSVSLRSDEAGTSMVRFQISEDVSTVVVQWEEPVPLPVSLTLEPASAESLLGIAHDLVATAWDLDGNPMGEVPLEWDSGGVGDLVVADPVTGPDGTAAGQALWHEPGQQQVQVSALCADGPCSTFADVSWVHPQGCTILGTAGSDVLIGTPGDDVICGFGGKDVLRGRGGNDTLLGGPGKDLVRGGRGRDFLRGGPGNDTLKGGRGGDTVLGGRGNDEVNGNRGRDSCLGGPGTDTLLNCELRPVGRIATLSPLPRFRWIAPPGAPSASPARPLPGRPSRP